MFKKASRFRTYTNASRARTIARMVQGASIGTITGCAGAYAMMLAYGDVPAYLLALVAICPAITGLLCGTARPHPNFTDFAPTPPSYAQDTRTMFVGGLSHMGSLIGLNHFLIRFGVQRGLFKSIADHKDITAHSFSGSAQEPTPPGNAKMFETQYPTVTTITYDTATNTPTSDTIARDRLASARLALLSMDHTKQIPH